MSTSNRKILSLGERPQKMINNQPGYTVAKPDKKHLANISSGDFAMDDGIDYSDDDRFNQISPQFGARGRKKHREQWEGFGDDSFAEARTGHGNRTGEAPNKIRRGPGRRLPKEKRARVMDAALMNKYASLPPSLQEKVNATIEIYYQQQMAKAYKGQVQEPEEAEADHYEEDVVYEAELEGVDRNPDYS